MLNIDKADFDKADVDKFLCGPHLTTYLNGLCSSPRNKNFLINYQEKSLLLPINTVELYNRCLKNNVKPTHVYNLHGIRVMDSKASLILSKFQAGTNSNQPETF